jgi:hypothetical protein
MLDAQSAQSLMVTVGLVLGGVFGIAGTMVVPPLRAILWAIDGAGLVMAHILEARFGLTIVAQMTRNEIAY